MKVRIIKFQKKWEAQALKYVCSVDKIIALGKKEPRITAAAAAAAVVVVVVAAAAR